MSIISEYTFDHLRTIVYEDRNSMGKAAANYVEEVINKLLVEQDEIRMVFAAAPSQNEFLAELINKNIDWKNVIAFHMDEYVGLKAGADELFGTFLRKNIFDKVNFKKVHFINPIYYDLDAECARYSRLLSERSIDIVCMGIGENGHLAFNDPPVADFNDPKSVKVVELDKACRAQQVNDGCFKKIEDVPTHAITLTIPTLISAKFLSVVVPGKSKATAVKNTLMGKITTDCPSTILRMRDNAVLFLDKDSAAKFSK